MSHPQARRARVLASENCLLQPNFGEYPPTFIDVGQAHILDDAHEDRVWRVGPRRARC
jgi:hypothetical protein